MIERPVVVKVFRLKQVDPAADAALKQAFYQEMQRTGLLMHHGIAALFDAGEEPGMLFMATEYVEGSNLADRLAEGITWDVAGAGVDRRADPGRAGLRRPAGRAAPQPQGRRTSSSEPAIR